MRRNSTLPIITDENSDNVFQRFIEKDSNSIIKNSSVWLDAHSRQVDESSTWHWIDGRSSGMVHLACITSRDVHGNGIPNGNGNPMGIPWEWD